MFLKNTVRGGELDQYFTPREIVEFMVRLADPDPSQIILDPACGSGGFLIQAFRHVNQKIINALIPEVQRIARFDDFVDRCLWGQEADYDLHVLAKMNLIMHGDGWNHIYQGDSLVGTHLPDNFANVVLMNPPFTISYPFQTTLSLYETGIGKASVELDILFVEKGLKCLVEGGQLLVVLPEGMLNTRSYVEFRQWLLSKCHVTAMISLPEGVFIPFGKSVSKTCILAVKKRHADDATLNKPNFVLLGRTSKIGFESGKRDYRPISDNDLSFILQNSTEIFEGIRESECAGECGWIESSAVTSVRLDATYYLNLVDRKVLRERHPLLVPLGDVCQISNKLITPVTGQRYNYLEVPDITEATGTITNMRSVDGAEVNSTMHGFRGGDVLYVRINPRISRVTLVPSDVKVGIVSKEVYRLTLKENPHIKDIAVVAAILQSAHVRSQAVRIGTGSSSSRARVHEEDLPSEVFIPIPTKNEQTKIAKRLRESVDTYWRAAQNFKAAYGEVHEAIGDPVDIDHLRRV